MALDLASAVTTHLTADGLAPRDLNESRSSESLRGFSVRQGSLQGRTANTECGLYLLRSSRLRA